MDASRFRSKRCRNVALILALGGVLHFALSMLYWSLLIRWAVQTEDYLRPTLLGTLPAFLLFAWFVAVLFTSLRNRRIAGWMLAVGFAASSALFIYDARTRNFQVHAENYHATGHQKTFYYATWWWYDESWLHR